MTLGVVGLNLPSSGTYSGSLQTEIPSFFHLVLLFT